jgi:hypothetical protein
MRWMMKLEGMHGLSRRFAYLVCKGEVYVPQ